MPKAKSKGGTATQAPPVKPKSRPKTAGDPKQPREVRYPELRVNGIAIPEDRLRFTVGMAKDAMGWETEDEYVARRTQADPSLALKADTIRWGDDYFCLDMHGVKVRCANNLTNRDFRAEDAKKYAQEILLRRWRMNGEPIIVGEYGDGLSLQHRCAALVFAAQLWGKDEFWRKHWDEEPYIHTLFVTGVKQDAETIQTYDCGVPRVLADTLITTGVFDDWRADNKPLTRAQKTEAGRLLDAACDLLWKRTGAGKDAHVHYPTNQALNDLRKRHPRLVDCARHVWEENAGKAISLLRLSPGDCAGLMYLMAASEDDGPGYREGDPPSEGELTLSRYDKAEAFIRGLGATPVIRKVLGSVVNGDYGANQLRDKKLAVLCKAWAALVEGRTGLEEDDLAPETVLNRAGEKVLGTDENGNFPNVGGIDLGMKPVIEEGEGGEPSEEEIAEAAEAARQKREEKKSAAKKIGDTSLQQDILDQIDGMKKEHVGHLLLMKSGNGVYTVWDKDAKIVSNVLGVKLNRHPSGLDRCFVLDGEVSKAIDKLMAAGHAVTVLDSASKAVISRHTPARMAGARANATAMPASKPTSSKGKKVAPKLKGGTEK